MTLIEFLNSLPKEQSIFLIVIIIMCVWGCFAPYFSLLHLGGIEQKLSRIADELAKLRTDNNRNGR